MTGVGDFAYTCFLSDEKCRKLHLQHKSRDKKDNREDYMSDSNNAALFLQLTVEYWFNHVDKYRLRQFAILRKDFDGCTDAEEKRKLLVSESDARN